MNSEDLVIKKDMRLSLLNQYFPEMNKQKQKQQIIFQTIKNNSPFKYNRVQQNLQNSPKKNVKSKSTNNLNNNRKHLNQKQTTTPVKKRKVTFINQYGQDYDIGKQQTNINPQIENKINQEKQLKQKRKQAQHVKKQIQSLKVKVDTLVSSLDIKASLLNKTKSSILNLSNSRFNDNNKQAQKDLNLINSQTKSSFYLGKNISVNFDKKKQTESNSKSTIRLKVYRYQQDLRKRQFQLQPTKTIDYQDMKENDFIGSLDRLLPTKSSFLSGRAQSEKLLKQQNFIHQNKILRKQNKKNTQENLSESQYFNQGNTPFQHKRRASLNEAQCLSKIKDSDSKRKSLNHDGQEKRQNNMKLATNNCSQFQQHNVIKTNKNNNRYRHQIQMQILRYKLLNKR